MAAPYPTRVGDTLPHPNLPYNVPTTMSHDVPSVVPASVSSQAHTSVPQYVPTTTTTTTTTGTTGFYPTAATRTIPVKAADDKPANEKVDEGMTKFGEKLAEVGDAIGGGILRAVDKIKPGAAATLANMGSDTYGTQQPVQVPIGSHEYVPPTVPAVYVSEHDPQPKTEIQRAMDNVSDTLAVAGDAIGGGALRAADKMKPGTAAKLTAMGSDTYGTQQPVTAAGSQQQQQQYGTGTSSGYNTAFPSSAQHLPKSTGYTQQPLSGPGSGLPPTSTTTSTTTTTYPGHRTINVE